MPLALDEIWKAIEADEFVPFFQPKVSLRGMDLAGVEALIRWKHPARGPAAGQRVPAAGGGQLSVRRADHAHRREVHRAVPALARSRVGRAGVGEPVARPAGRRGHRRPHRGEGAGPRSAGALPHHRGVGIRGRPRHRQLAGEPGAVAREGLWPGHRRLRHRALRARTARAHPRQRAQARPQAAGRRNAAAPPSGSCSRPDWRSRASSTSRRSPRASRTRRNGTWSTSSAAIWRRATSLPVRWPARRCPNGISSGALIRSSRGSAS